MRLATVLLPLVVLVHTSAWQLGQRHQMVEDRAFAVPQSHVLDERVDSREVEEPRALHGTRKAAVLGVLVSLIADIIPGLLSILDQEDRECQFIGKVNATVLLDYRDLNVVIFHDTSSNYEGLQNSICFDQDLPLPLDIGSKTYRICAFETGTFIRHGDGGCRNWGFGACFKRTNDKTVSFCRREAAATPTTTPQKATTTTRFTTTTEATTTRPQTTRSVSGSRCPTGEALCNTECIPANSVCCPGGGYCDQGYVCTSDNKCQVAPGSGGGGGSNNCGAGMVSCDSSFCIPSGGVCCSQGNGNYCGAGYSCLGTGCCENGKTCGGGGNPGAVVTVTLEATAPGATVGGNNGAAVITVTQDGISPPLPASTRTSSSESMPTIAPGLSVPACLGVGVAAVMALMG